MIRTNIRIYLYKKNNTNEYPNIFASKKWYEYDTNEYSYRKIFECIRISEYSPHPVLFICLLSCPKCPSYSACCQVPCSMSLQIINKHLCLFGSYTSIYLKSWEVLSVTFVQIKQCDNKALVIESICPKAYWNQPYGIVG